MARSRAPEDLKGVGRVLAGNGGLVPERLNHGSSGRSSNCHRTTVSGTPGRSP